MTYLVVESRFASDAAAEHHVRDVLASFGATFVDALSTTARGQLITTTFDRVCDATHAASSLLQHFKALTAWDQPNVSRGVRIVFGAEPLDYRSEAQLAPPGHEEAMMLLRHAGVQEVLTTSSSAVVAGPTLPADVDLVDRGVDECGCDDHGRLYQLRVHDDERVDVTPSTASNLDWARRMAEHRVPWPEAGRAALVDRWKRALEGNGSVVLLTSADGSVASGSAAELALRVHADGGLVLRGGWDQNARRPYGAFREALGIYAAECGLAGMRADLDRRGWEVARFIPELGVRLGGRSTPPRTPDADRRVGDAVSDWISAIVTRGPLLAVFDNVQWADPESLNVCEQLSNDLADRCVLVVLCGAEDDMRSEGVLDASTAVAVGGDLDEHWIALGRR